MLMGWMLPSESEITIFWGQSEQIWIFLRPDGPSEQSLAFSVHACCDPNIFGEIFEILSVHNAQIFGNFHLASPPIIGGPVLPHPVATRVLRLMGLLNASECGVTPQPFACSMIVFSDRRSSIILVNNNKCIPLRSIGYFPTTYSGFKIVFPSKYLNFRSFKLISWNIRTYHL